MEGTIKNVSEEWKEEGDNSIQCGEVKREENGELKSDSVTVENSGRGKTHEAKS